MRTRYEVADAVKLVDTSKGFSSHQRKVFKDITECRTEALGGHAKRCSNSECGNVEASYNSCRNRACPKCGWKKQQEWILKISANILPARHFHTVFTIPHEFNNFFLYNKSAFSNILFKSSSKAVLDLIKTKWKVKGGHTSVLHTWGSSLNLHPHVHMIVPAGGFCVDTGKWKGFRKQYLANREALALRFRNLFMKEIKKMIRKGELVVPSCHGYLNDDASLLDFFEKPHSKKWNVFVKKTFGGEVQVIKYLGRYVYRSAISNSRILSVDQDRVRFKFKNYRTKNFNDVTQVDTRDFVRRLSYHSCEKGFQRIRHGGIYGNAVKAINVSNARLQVYGEALKPVCVLKEVYKIERKISQIIESISICSQCSCSFERVAFGDFKSSA